MRLGLTTALITAACVLAAPLVWAGPPEAAREAGLPIGLPPPPTIITNPDWVRPPTSDEASQFYPPIATLLAIEGHATIECEVELNGMADHCEVAQETPKGLGFGKAAIDLSRYFVMTPMTASGVPVAGGRVIVPISFTDPAVLDEAPAATPPPAVSAIPADVLALARRVATATLTARIAATEQQLRTELVERFAEPTVTEEQQAAIDDYVAATGDVLKATVDDEARRYAQTFTPAQLSQLADFFESPLGQTWSRHGAAEAATPEDIRPTEVQVRDAARRRFCADHTCNPTPPPGH